MNRTPSNNYLRSMKQFYLALLLILGLAAPSAHAQQSYYLISGTVSNPPPINATTVENIGNITAINFYDDTVFDFLNLENFINRGDIFASPGIDISKITITPDYRGPATSVINEQNIYANPRLLIDAASVQNRNNSLLATPRNGLVQIKSSGNVDLLGGRVTAGDGTTFGNATEGNFSLRVNNNFFYLNPDNVRDDYWGSTNGGNLSLSLLSVGGTTPSHRTFVRGTPEGFSYFQSLTVNPFSSSSLYPLTNSFSTNGFLFFISSNNFNSINNTTYRDTTQIVFIRTNESSPDIQVSFPSSTNSAGFRVNDIVVQFGTSDVDPITGQTYQRYFVLYDESMFRSRINNSGAQSTLNLQANDDRPGYFRPLAYTILRSDFPAVFPLPGGFPNFGGSPYGVAPSTYDPNMIFPGSFNFNGRFATNTVDHEYSAYGFTVGARDFGGDLGLNPTLSDATNSPGRLTIEANSISMVYSKLAAHNLISLTVTNGFDLTGALLSAPNIKLTVPGTGNTIFSNNFPDNVTRLNGQVAVWTAIYQIDQLVTNLYIPGFTGTVEHAYQVMVIDNTLSTNVPVVLRDFNANSSEVIVGDNLTFGGSLLIGGNCLHIPTNGIVTLNAENTDFNVVDAPSLRCLINDGTFGVPLLINLGADRSAPYTNIANSGTMQSGSILMRSELVTNTGVIFTTTGNLGITGLTNRFNGGFLFSAGNIILAGDHLTMTGAVLSAAQQITMRFTNFLGDNGVTNTLSVGNGFSLLSHPNKGDLMATHITSTAPNAQARFHVWGGENRGATPSGFANNTAIQHLTLNGGTNSIFFFQGVGANDAMYVNYLEFLGGTTNTNGLHVTSTLSISPNLTIYFADSNVPEDKLTNAFPGRLVWVDPSITTGPMVAIPLVAGQYAQLSTRQFQTLLAPGGDYDGDGIPNELDDSPMSGFTVSDVTLLNLPPLTAFIKWQAIAGLTYTIEYSDSVASGVWHTLYSITAVESKALTAIDLPPAGGQRFYRVRYTVN